MYRLWQFVGVLLCTGLVIGVLADEGEMITADTVRDLSSVLTIDFADAPPQAGEIISGWFRVDPTGTYVVNANRESELVVWNIQTGDLEAVYRVVGADGVTANMMDMAWDADGTTIHSLHTDGNAYLAAAYTLGTDEPQVVQVPAENDRPVRVWAGATPNQTWVEVIPTDPARAAYVVQLDIATGDVLANLPSVAEADRESQVRIGRMPAPLAVTSSIQGNVQLWDLEAGELLERVDLGAMPTFGHINGAAGRVLAWRDTASEALYLLDFTTGQNQEVAPLNGSYVQALLLTPSNDVVLGVNVDLAPVVVAWDVSTGQQFDLGEYRTCSRTPDMMQISEDGTALVIGCDTGLDVWRVPDAEEATSE